MREHSPGPDHQNPSRPHKQSEKIQMTIANNDTKSAHESITSVPPSRRRFLAIAGGASATLAVVATQPALAAPGKTLDASKASPTLRAAVRALVDSNSSLEAAKARFNADDIEVSEWAINNPKPEGKRALKRWWRHWRENRDAVEGESWEAQLAAEKDFRAAQIAVANVIPRDENDLALKAAVAFVYDRVQAGHHESIAIISYSVALDLLRSRMPA
jgi:hypothetical protein